MSRRHAPGTLDWRQDRALFDILQHRRAFRDHDTASSGKTDLQLYEELRDEGAQWCLHCGKWYDLNGQDIRISKLGKLEPFGPRKRHAGTEEEEPEEDSEEDSEEDPDQENLADEMEEDPDEENLGDEVEEDPDEESLGDEMED